MNLSKKLYFCTLVHTQKKLLYFLYIGQTDQHNNRYMNITSNGDHGVGSWVPSSWVKLTLMQQQQLTTTVQWWSEEVIVACDSVIFMNVSCRQQFSLLHHRVEIVTVISVKMTCVHKCKLGVLKKYSQDVLELSLTEISNG